MKVSSLVYFIIEFKVILFQTNVEKVSYFSFYCSMSTTTIPWGMLENKSLYITSRYMINEFLIVGI